MTTETKEIDRLIEEVRHLRGCDGLTYYVEKIAELAERVVHLEDERNSERTGAADQRNNLVEQLAELTKSRDYNRSHFLSAMEEVATLKQTVIGLSSGWATTEIEALKQTIEDQKQKCSRAIIELVTSMPMTDRIARALAVLNE